MDRPKPAPPSGRLVAIEALRGVAALSVAVAHVLGVAAADGVAPSLPLAVPWLAGVDVFFVVSGFVMVHAARERFGRPGARRDFLSHRVARVVPLYWIVTTVFVVLALLRPSAFTDPLDGWRTVLASYVFVPWPRADGSLLPVFRLGWTLQFEALFYLIFAAWVGARRGIGLAGILACLVGLVALGVAWPAAPPTVRFWTDPILLEFALGMVLAMARDAGARLNLAVAPCLVAAGLGLLLRTGEVPLGWMRPLAYGLPAVLLVALALLRPRPVLPSLVRWLALRAGALSYALYLSHLFAVRGVREAARLVPLPGAMFVPVALVAAVALAVVVHWWIERPAVASVRRWLA